MRRERPSAGLLLIDGGYVLLGAVLAVVLAWPIYEDARVWLVGGTGAVIGLGAALGGRLLRLPWWSDLLAAVALYLLVAVPVAIPSAFPDRWLGGLRDAAFGVVTGWKDLVTLDLPLGAYQAVLVPLLVVMLFGTYAAARVAFTARRAQVVVPVIVLAMLAFGVVFGVGGAGFDGPYAFGRLPLLPWVGVVTVSDVAIVAVAAFVVLSLVRLAVRARRVRAEALARGPGVALQRSSGWAALRRGGVAAAMVAFALVVAGFVAIPASGAPRDVIRDHVRPIEFVAEQSSPLSGYREWMSDASYDAELFSVVAPAGVARLRLAVLDAYDGTRFTVSSLATGSRFVRTATRPSAAGAQVEVTISDGYTAPWVPLPGDVSGPAAFPGSADRAAALADSLYYSTDASLAVVLAENAAGTTGFEAGDRVVAVGAPQADGRERIGAIETSGAPINGVTEDAYPELATWVESQAVGPGGAGFVALIDRLRERGYLSHGYRSDEAAASAWERDLLARDGAYEFEPSRAGHSAQRIEDLFLQLNDRQRQAGGADGDAGDLVAGVGDDEQFATAAALIAWSRGIPARVVLGVRLAEDPAGATGIAPAIEPCTASGGSYSCAGRNVGAWIEVNAGGAWVPLDTSPQFERSPRLSAEGENPPAHGTLPERPASSVIDPPDAAKPSLDSEAAAQEPIGPPHSQGALAALRIAAVAAAAVGLLLIPPGILVGAKALRRSRRRASAPEVAIVGAWEELIDECVDLGLLPRAAGGTRSQLAARLDDPVAHELAAAADRAVFGAALPAESDRELAWTMVREERRRLRRFLPLLRRIRGLLSPASFVRHLRPTSARRTLESDRGGDGR